MSVEILVQLVPNVTPLRLFSRLAHEPIIPVWILTTTISMREIPATNITGLKTIEIRLEIENIFNIPESPHLLSNTFIRIRNGDPIINIRRNPILIILAMSNNKSPTVKKNNIKNLRANQRVKFATHGSLSVPR